MINESLYNEMCNEFFPVFKKLAATDVYSITLGGSYGKGKTDQGSDFDFRIYFDNWAEKDIVRSASEEVKRLVEKWKAKGVKVDGVWPRTYADVDEQLEVWFAGKGALVQLEWSIWGYNILTDIYNQQIIEDLYSKAALWKEKLSVYPEPLKKSILSRYVSSLKYWRNDYHYSSKVNRKDIVFLASITARLVQDIVQAVYALNEFYYPGDGMNLEYSQQFALKPRDFEERVATLLRTSQSDDTYIIQYNNMIKLIDDTLSLVENNYKL